MPSITINCSKCGVYNHFQREELYCAVYCQWCQQEISRPENTRDAHSELCSYCNIVVDPDKIKIHNDTCEMYPIDCKFCSGKFIRRSMDIHAQECARNLRRCKFSPIGCQYQGTQLDVEKHESGNFHADLLIKLFLNLQTEQSNNASMLARSSFELLSLKDDNARRKSSAGVECDLKNAACNQDVNSQQSEFAINIKPKLDKLEETVKRQEMELNSCKQRITDLELKQTKLMAQNTQLEYNYGSVKDLLEQQSKEIEKLEKSLEFQVEYSNKKLEKDLDDLRLKQNGFELNYANSKEMLTKQQTEQFDNVENYQKTLNTVITANNRLTKAVAEDKKILSDKIDALSEKQIGFEDEYTRDKATFSYLWRIEKFEQQLDEAKLDRENAMYSHPFYSSKFGYKLQLLLCPNGGNQEDNEDTHLSIYLYVLKGVNDAILNWPIRYTAKYSILDQLNRKDHYSGTIESDVVNGLNRPLDEENMGYGIETYIELDKLKPLYLVDDTIFIKLDLNVTS